MKILVLGAGVLGCNLANDLFREKKDVTLLARGAWGEQLQKNGLKIMCATSLGKICASDHAMNAVDEMNELNHDIKQFFENTGAEYPVWQALEQECGRYLRRSE